MNPSKLLLSLLRRCLSLGVVEIGGGAVVEDDVEQPGADASGAAGSSSDVDADTGATGSDAGAAGVAEGSDATGAAAADAGAAEEIVVSLGEEQPAPEEDERRAPEWLRELRKANREKDRRIRELEGRLAQANPAPAAVVVGDKPTMESCDFDADRFATELEAWHGRKMEADKQARERAQAEDQVRAQWQTRIDAVGTASSSLKLADLEDATHAFEDTFSLVQQGIVIGGPEDPKTAALLRYALGKNPGKAKELAAIKDPVKFAFAVARLETQLKVTPRKAAPAPDKPVRSTVAGAAAVDNQLLRLQEEADRTGDRTKVAAYLRDKQRAKQVA